MDTNIDFNVRNVVRVALYIRVSSQEQVEGYSIGEQTDRLKKYAEAMNWHVYKIYVDPGYSGGNTDRPGLNEMIKDVERGEIDKVVVYKLDRLSRSQFDTLYLIEKVFLANNTDFVSMTENFNTSSPLGRAMIGFLAVFAQLEKDKINERMVMGKEARAKEGKWGGGKSVPTGYDYDITTGELTINEYEAMQIREAVDLFLKGTPIRTICTIFDKKGYTYKNRSTIWDTKRLKYIFTNKTYIGYIRHNDNWYEGSHEPILDNDTFDRVQKLLEIRAEKYGNHKAKCAGHSSYFGGMIYCKNCGARYTRQENGRRKPGKDLVYWYMCYSRCKKSKSMIKDPTCRNKNWKMLEFDNVVFDEIKKLATEPGYLNKIRRDKEIKTDTPNKIEIIKKEIQNIENQISRFMDLYGIGKFTIDQVSSKVDPLNAQRVGLEKELEDMVGSEQEIDDDEAIRLVQSFEEIFERGDFNEIRLTLESLIYFIEVDEEDIYIHWKFM